MRLYRKTSLFLKRITQKNDKNLIKMVCYRHVGSWAQLANIKNCFEAYEQIGAKLGKIISFLNLRVLFSLTQVLLRKPRYPPNQHVFEFPEWQCVCGALFFEFLDFSSENWKTVFWSVWVLFFSQFQNRQ